MDFSWDIPPGRESDVYNYKYFASKIKINSLPKSASQYIAWFTQLVAMFSSLDLTTTGVLARWIRVCCDPIGHCKTVCSRFHRDSQGFLLLDRLFGALFCEDKFLEDREFGLNFLNYYETCQAACVDAKGKVFVAMIAIRWRGDRRRARCTTIFNLLNIQLHGLDDKHIMEFMARVRYALRGVKRRDIKDPELMFEWLWAKVKDRTPLQRVTDRIKRADEHHKPHGL